ncbi:hypothetical protein G6F22_009075 [Rhizopus arrhizus]|nr:hypothetical protein G6F22_009075 [Rhizopus arrhizus]KAG1091072.1 hypothetical protein G6F40_013026 [Rhizopus arrhizus]KAG1228058.1 hypothetical protein G6F68_019525 [Rhizopus microsporus]
MGTPPAPGPCHAAVPASDLHRACPAAGAAHRRIQRADARLPRPRRQTAGRRHAAGRAEAAAGRYRADPARARWAQPRAGWPVCRNP